MTPEAQRIAIAEACGFRIVRIYFAQVWSPDGRRGHCCGLHLDDQAVWHGHFSPHEEKPLLIPDYLSDLNAMHEVEKAVIYPRGLAMVYLTNLQEVANNLSPAKFDDTSCTLYCSSATAGQRAEAFLRTVLKWEAIAK